MKSLLSVLSVTVLVAPPCALAGIVVRASERARHAKDPRRPRRGMSERARRGMSPSGRGAIHCDRSRKASCRSTRSARRHEGTEEVESWFTRTSITCCLTPRLGKARSLSDAPPASAPTLVGARVPRARPAPRSAVGHHAHGVGRRGRRPLPPILPRRGSAREGPATPRRRAVRRWRGHRAPGPFRGGRKSRFRPTRRKWSRGVTRRVEEFYDGIEKRRRNEELEAFQHEGKQDGHDVPPFGVCPSFDNGVWA